ncbi:MAG TPA: 5-(carboxyamino)imidazole ribonucleotide mutase [Bacteriovoracaceae bacterium]|nr:5-(carboxyamino)imidazole ribonucleotide mutase [Bacteriovoracaceae bacterium]
MSNQAIVGIIMGSESDWPTMKDAETTLARFDVKIEVEVVSAHRTPERMVEYAQTAAKRGIKVIIAGAGGSAHLPGMVAAMTTVPVIGVPVETQALKGLDSLLSIVQMPKGVPVATMAIGNSMNAALLAVRILATSDKKLEAAIAEDMKQMEDKVKTMNENLKGRSK